MNSASVDLIYLDPPFNSNRTYKAPIGSKAAGASFKDAWTLDDVDVHEHGELADRNPASYSVIEASRQAHGKGMQSYLIFMAVRLLEMRRVLKSTGSIYLHCDPTASHYLKLLMDSIFSVGGGFLNEIIWHYGQRTTFLRRNFSAKHDVVFFYANGKETSFNKVPIEWKREEFLARRHDVKVDENGREFIWTDGGPKGKRYKRFVDEVLKAGKPMDDVWDIPILNSAAKERVGYPTQKPLALLDRIVKASSNEGDMVLDPFCGCATALVAADRLQRKWAGIDLSPLAIKLVNDRIAEDRYDKKGGEVIGGGLFKAIAQTDPPKRTDLGDLPNYRTHRHRLYGEQEGVCNGCETHFPFRVMDVDHILPRSKGGTDHADNLQLLCSGCNRAKGGRTMAEWRAAK